jgi:hypothetical protein
MFHPHAGIEVRYPRRNPDLGWVINLSRSFWWIAAAEALPSRELVMSRRISRFATVPSLVIVMVLVVGALALSGVSPAGADESPSVTIAAVTNVTFTTATLNGSVNPNGVSTTYYFVYEPVSGLPSVTTPPMSVGSGTLPVNVSATAYGLLPNAEYWVWMCATNADSVTSRSATVMFIASEPAFTSQTTAPDVMTDGETAVTSTTATLNGTVNPNGASTSYVFHYGLSEGATSSSTDYFSAGSGTSSVAVSADVTGLKPDTTYYFYLFANDVSDDSVCNTGSILRFETLSPASSTTATSETAPSSTKSIPRKETAATTATAGAANTAASSTPPRQGAGHPKIVIDSRAIVRSRVMPTTAAVKLSCTVATCPGSVRLEETVGKVRLLASGIYRIGKGKTEIVFLRLTSAGRVALAHVAKRPLREVLIATVKGGNTSEMRVLVS